MSSLIITTIFGWPAAADGSQDAQHGRESQEKTHCDCSGRVRISLGTSMACSFQVSFRLAFRKNGEPPGLLVRDGAEGSLGIVVLLGFDQQHDADRQQRDARKRAEDQVERHVPARSAPKAQSPKPPQLMLTKFHDAVAGGAQFGPGDLAQDGHVVAVEETPAEAKSDQADK